MRFDDTLDTVLATTLDTPASRSAAWRQIVDLVGRGRAPPSGAALAALDMHRDAVPLAARAASARALFGARPPAALVRMLALDDIAVAAPVLRGAELEPDAWIALLPALSPRARAVLRHRRDLPAEVTRALAAFGPIDFVLPADAPTERPEVAPATALSGAALGETGPFVSVGAIARGLPLVAEALRRGNDNEAPPAAPDGTFRIADVVARIEAFRRRREEGEAMPAAAPPSAPQDAGRFRFETDSTGVVCWTDAEPRGALIGIGIARAAAPGAAGVDGTAAGAFRRRARITAARLAIEGGGEVGGLWLLSAVPVFDRVTGRFTGYRGSARRPRADERADAPRPGLPAADSLRQLVHELRTPTNAIAGFSEMIEHQMLGPVADPYRAQASAIRGDSGALLAAIDDLDAAARIEAGALELRPEAVALAPLLARIAGDLVGLAEARGTTLAIDAGDAIVQADARALERLLARLCATMLGAASAGEAIALRAVEAGAGRIALSIDRPAALAAHPGDTVLAIDDEAGPASLLGTGFALRLVRNLARALGGSLTFGERCIGVHLPAATAGTVERARTS